MKAIILAGGKGTRLAEETTLRPKPMVEIGGKPILWHIMNIYAAHGCKEFLVACGYKGEMIKEYFHNYVFHNSDYIVDLRDGSKEIVGASGIDWKVGVIDTGLNSQTGGRLLRLRKWVKEETFMVTYGDGVGDINISDLLDFHRKSNRIATVTAVRPPARFGDLHIQGDAVKAFLEKPQAHEGWINGGYFVFEPEVFRYLKGDESILEREALESLADDGQLGAFLHSGFWQPMDTLREKQILENLWESGAAPWKTW